MPSGMLWTVIAVTSSGVGEPRPAPPQPRRAMKPSSSMRNTAPAAMPSTAGSHSGSAPAARVRSTAGIIMLHTEAASITPAAKPIMTAWSRSFISPAKKNTTAAPSVVIKNIKPVPSEAQAKERSMCYQRLLSVLGADRKTHPAKRRSAAVPGVCLPPDTL